MRHPIAVRQRALAAGMNRAPFFLENERRRSRGRASASSIRRDAMHTAVGVFETRAVAQRSMERLLEELGVERGDVNLLVPEDANRLHEKIPTTDAEPPGVGAAIGGVIGTAAGAFGGLAVASTLLVPGVGLVSAIGVAAAAMLGA